jgi:hypothetical protein
LALRRPPHRQGEAPARPEYAARLRQRRRGVRHQHVAEPAEDAVDRVGLELDPLSVDAAVFDVLHAELGGAAAADLEHRRREVGRDESTIDPRGHATGSGMPFRGDAVSEAT